MNLYLIVEGNRTEPRVYPEWMRHMLPRLGRVYAVEHVIEDHYVLIKGGGEPAYETVITSAVEDMWAQPDVFDALMVCVDAERLSAEERRAHISALVADAGGLPPRAELVVIVADCCIETWFLGNRRLCAPQPSSPELQMWRAFYNVRDEDPEGLPQHHNYGSRAQTHERYLRDMLAERNISYNKNNAGEVAAVSYLESLRERVRATPHLASLRELLAVWERWALS